MTINCMEKFYTLYRKGEIPADYIDYYIESWHNGNSQESLYEFLGIPVEIYNEWVKSVQLPKFNDLYKKGESSKESIFNFIERWRESGTGEPMYTFLGMSVKECRVWLHREGIV